MTPRRRCQPGSGATRSEPVFPTTREGPARGCSRHAVVVGALVPPDAARAAIRIATRVATVYTNAPIRRGEARSSHLCTLLRPHVCPQQRNSVHKCPKTAPRGHSSQFVYTLALSPARATRCHRVAGRSCTRRHRVARKSVYAQLSGNVVPLDAIEWHDHRALGNSEWHNRASQSWRQPERLVVVPWLTGGGVRSAGGSGASA